MDNTHIYSILQNMNVNRNMIFTSLSSQDKDIALRLIKKIEGMNLNHWCMYDENGKERNISGDVYTEVISRMLKKCCVFLIVLSKHSLSSLEVRREIREVVETAKTEKYSSLKIIPILTDDTDEDDIPEEVVRLSGITSEVIVRHLTMQTSEEELDHVCEEIRSQYIATVLQNIKKRFILEKESNRFLDMMDSCIKRKCWVASVSESIKQCREVYTDSLREAHIVSNEMLDFDCNPFSCMIIASNIRGNEIWDGETMYYDPEKNGVKYFYYYPEVSSAQYKITFEKIKSYLSKDKISRREVTNTIRREFCHRNKVIGFFLEFNNMTQNKFVEHYHIVEEKDLLAFDTLFSEEQTQFYFAYSDADDIFQIPEEFVAWTSGDMEKFTYNSMLDVSYKFIDFIGKFLSVLQNSEDINKVSFDELNKNYQYLLKLQKMEQWQNGYIRLNKAESRRLINYLFDYTVGAVKEKPREFPKLVRWLEIEYDNDGREVYISEDVRQKAIGNLIGIPLKKNDALKLCYTFNLFIEDAIQTGGWYSVEQSKSVGYESMCFNYEIDQRSDLFDDLVSAFRYLIDIYPNAYEILSQKKSRILNL